VSAGDGEEAAAATEPPPPTLVLIGLDARFLEPLTALAETEGWRAVLRRGAVRPAHVAGLRPSAAILDADALGGGLWSLVSALRHGDESLGLVVAASRSTRGDRVLGLRSGADFWVSKSLDPVELMAIVVVSTRAGRADRHSRTPIEVGDLWIEPRRVLAAGVEVPLTRRELIMTAFLASHHGLCLNREEIYEGVWGGTMPIGDRAVDSVIHRLRRKLEVASPDHDYLHTHYGIGYRFEAVRCEEAGAPAIAPGRLSGPASLLRMRGGVAAAAATEA
jgi:DNA-binding response OmpR family regulator